MWTLPQLQERDGFGDKSGMHCKISPTLRDCDNASTPIGLLTSKVDDEPYGGAETLSWEVGDSAAVTGAFAGDAAPQLLNGGGLPSERNCAGTVVRDVGSCRTAKPDVPHVASANTTSLMVSMLL
jgi:hypothetical protein